MAVEPSLCSSTFQDLAEPASKAATRAEKPSTDCSMFEILFMKDATNCV